MEITDKLYREIKKTYEKELATAKVGYFRNMTYIRKQGLLNMIRTEIPEYNVCLSCNTGVLKMLNDVNNAKIKYLKENTEKNETSTDRGGQKKRGRKVKGA